jgi:hypothetical protein
MSEKDSIQQDQDSDYVKGLLKLRLQDRLTRLGLNVKRLKDGTLVIDHCIICQGPNKLHVSQKTDSFYCFQCEYTGNLKSLLASQWLSESQRVKTVQASKKLPDIDLDDGTKDQIKDYLSKRYGDDKADIYISQKSKLKK